MNAAVFAAAADVVLALHALFVAFVVLTLPLVFVGAARRWRWVRNRRFRLLHLVAIGVVVLQAWIGMVCPLTSWETALRTRAGESGYAIGFIAHWLQALLYWQAPEWVFTLVYTAFGLLVAASWIAVPPRRAGRSEPTGHPMAAEPTDRSEP